VTVVPFFYYYSGLNKKILFLSLALLPLFLWALVLTASRSGFVALVSIVVIITLKSRHKVTIALAVVLGVCLAFPFLSSDQKDRYLSIVDHNTKNAATSEGRLTGIQNNLKVAMRRPLFGHGLGTSLEANANFGHNAQPAHNLFAEVAQELGFIGVVLFLCYIIATYKTLKHAEFSRAGPERRESPFVVGTWHALQTFFYMNVLFSLASFGLSGYEWYLIPGLIVVLSRIQYEKQDL
jgi:O-antigen ligase